VKKATLILFAFVALALTGGAATADKATLATVVSVTATTLTTNVVGYGTPVLLAAARADRIGLSIQNLSGVATIGYAFSTNSFTTAADGYDTIASGTNALFDNVNGPVVPLTAVYGMTLTNSTNAIRVIEFRRPTN
jgi:hypothetical protein